MRFLQQARERLAQRTEFVTVTLVLGGLLGILTNIWADMMRGRPALVTICTLAALGIVLWLMRALSLMDIEEFEYVAVLPTRDGQLAAGPAERYGLVALAKELHQQAEGMQSRPPAAAGVAPLTAIAGRMLPLIEAALLVRMAERSLQEMEQLELFGQEQVRGHALGEMNRFLADNPYLRAHAGQHPAGASCFYLPEGVRLRRLESRVRGRPGFDLLFRFPGRGWVRLRLRLMMLERVRQVNWTVGENVGVFAPGSRPLIFRLWVSGRFRVKDELLNAWLSLVTQDLQDFLDFEHFIKHSHLELLLEIQSQLRSTPEVTR